LGFELNEHQDQVNAVFSALSKGMDSANRCVYFSFDHSDKCFAGAGDSIADLFW
jgi:hypothetical protein